MRSMSTISHVLTLFFSSGFISAAALQAYVSGAGWLDVRGVRLAVPAILTNGPTALLFCALAAAVITLTVEIRRARSSVAR